MDVGREVVEEQLFVVLESIFLLLMHLNITDGRLSTACKI
jgi:hypothetical protein